MTTSPFKMVHVRVVITENGNPAGEMDITYFRGQPYVVKIDTPDGLDLAIERFAGTTTETPEEIELRRAHLAVREAARRYEVARAGMRAAGWVVVGLNRWEKQKRAG